MKNFTTFKTESYMGALLLLIMGAFMVGFFILAIKSFDSDVEMINIGNAKIKTVSDSEKSMMSIWASRRDVNIPEGESFYQYLLKNYPSKPWVNE